MTEAPEVHGWMGVVQALLGGAMLWAFFWAKSFLLGKSEQVEHSAKSGAITETAIGAAFVDKRAATAMERIADDVNYIRMHVEGIRKEKEHEDAIQEVLDRLKQEEAALKRPPPPLG